MALSDFFAGKRVLVTGHAGFKGTWLTLLLKLLGAEVYGYSLLPASSERMYELVRGHELLSSELIADVTDLHSLQRFVAQSKPQLVLHLAAQPLVIESYLDPLTTYRTNVLGTLNVLAACQACPSVQSLTVITTDKCYENHDEGRPFKETDPLGGYDMYSSSKACAEILCASFRNSFLHEPGTMHLATARAGNVIGGGDFAANRLVPDCVRALSRGASVMVRNPHATRPWQHVLEPLYGYLTLARALYEGQEAAASAFNFGPNPDSVLTAGEVVAAVTTLWGSTGGDTAQSEGQLGSNSARFHEAALLSLDNRKAREVLGVKPALPLKEALELTVAWYRAWAQHSSTLRELSWQQIEHYLHKVEEA